MMIGFLGSSVVVIYGGIRILFDYVDKFITRILILTIFIYKPYGKLRSIGVVIFLIEI